MVLLRGKGKTKEETKRNPRPLSTTLAELLVEMAILHCHVIFPVELVKKERDRFVPRGRNKSTKLAEYFRQLIIGRTSFPSFGVVLSTRVSSYWPRYLKLVFRCAGIESGKYIYIFEMIGRMFRVLLFQVRNVSGRLTLGLKRRGVEFRNLENIEMVD